MENRLGIGSEEILIKKSQKNKSQVDPGVDGACACGSQKSRRQKIDGCQKQTEAVQENFLVSLSRNVLLLEEGLIYETSFKRKPVNNCDDIETQYL